MSDELLQAMWDAFTAAYDGDSKLESGRAVLDVLHKAGYRRCAEGQRTTQWCDRAEKAEAEVERLRGVLKTDSEQQAAHIRGLNESWEAEREILAAEIGQLTSERDAFMEMAERLTADLEALRARVFVRR